MEHQDVLEAVRHQILEVLDVEPTLITPDAELAATLGADSVHLLEIAGQLETQYGIELDDRELYDAVTVGDLVELIVRKR